MSSKKSKRTPRTLPYAEASPFGVRIAIRRDDGIEEAIIVSVFDALRLAGEILEVSAPVVLATAKLIMETEMRKLRRVGRKRAKA